ncbi:M16 family metallopeptidase [Aliikangiella sp. IMCC44359]|uniref:M16 family metallopeptidase n=1 Tax=Aliikangiella sp. IMCC44359 TaxID=3459125 RepID=UPI00403B0903
MKKQTLFLSIICSIMAISACNSTDNRQNQLKHQTDSSKTSSHKKATSQTNELEIQYKRFTLDNGLDVIFHVDRSDPVVAVALTAHVGSARELPGRTGFAHLFEHLLFLESENLGKGGLDKMSARIGGSGANGSTSRDRTNYFQTVPKNALEKMIWAEADKLGFFINTVTEQVLAKEKQVVKNEKRQSNDNRPYGHTQYVIDKNLYPKGHPYSWQVIGSLEDLQNATLQDVKDFFKRWYAPNNVTLVISGDFNENQAKKWIHKYFDEIPRGETVERNKKQPTSLKQSKRMVFEDNFAKLPELTITWPTVPLYHPDSYALKVLRQLLSNGKKAALNKLLIDELKLTNQVRMGGYDSELAGQTTLRVQAFENTDLNKVYQAISTAFKNFEQDSFTEQDLARIKAEQETAFYNSLSSVLGKGFMLAQYKIYKNDPGFINQDVKNILAVSKKDVLNVYKKYIKNKNYIATSFVPKGQKALALENSIDASIVEEKIIAGAEESFDASQKATYIRTPSQIDRSEPPYDKTPVIIKSPKVWQAQATNGLKTYGIHNDEVPLVNFSLNIAGGMLFDDPEKIGVANLVARSMNKGTKRKTPQQLEEAIKQLGAQIEINANKQSITIDGNTLAKNYKATMALVSEILLEPRWDEKEFILIKESVLSEIKQQQARPPLVAENQFNQLLYGKNHLLANNLLGNEKSISKIAISDLKAYYQKNFSPSLANLHIVGDINQSEVVNSLKLLEEKWGRKNIKLPNISIPSASKKAQLYFYDIPKAKQSVINIGYLALKATDQDFYPAQVSNYLLGGGGFASQLTQQLREAKGYTYRVRSGFTGNTLDGRFTINSGVRANVTFESVQLIRKILSEYQTNLTNNDLEVTKSYFLKSNARRFETPDAKLNILYNMSQFSLPADYVQQRAKSLESLTLKQMKSLAQKHIRPDDMIYLVVGDAETQLDRLKNLGLGDPILLNP